MKEVSREFKEKYNALLLREKKGRKMIDSAEATEEQREKWLNGKNGYMDICKSLSNMMWEYNNITGKVMEDNIILGGFADV